MIEQIELMRQQIEAVVEGPPIAAVVGGGILRAVKKVEPGFGMQSVLVARIGHDLDRDAETALRKAFAESCRNHNVFLFCSSYALDARFSEEAEGVFKIRVRSNGEPRDEPTLQALVDEYVGLQKRQGLNLTGEILPW